MLISLYIWCDFPTDLTWFFRLSYQSYFSFPYWIINLKYSLYFQHFFIQIFLCFHLTDNYILFSYFLTSSYFIYLFTFHFLQVIPSYFHKISQDFITLFQSLHR